MLQLKYNENMHFVNHNGTLTIGLFITFHSEYYIWIKNNHSVFKIKHFKPVLPLKSELPLEHELPLDTLSDYTFKIYELESSCICARVISKYSATIISQENFTILNLKSIGKNQINAYEGDYLLQTN